MKYSLIVLTLISFLYGCKKDGATTSQHEFSKIVDLSLHKTLSNELGIYTGQFQFHNGNVNIRSTIRSNVDNETSYSGRITAWNLENLSSGQPVSTNGGDYYINNIHLRYDGTSGYVIDQFIGDNNKKDVELINDFIGGEVVGKEITIKNVLNGEELFNESFYVPKEIELSGLLENKIPETNFIKMGRNNFSFGYNYDDRNENGLLVRLEYNGEFHGMELGDFENIDPQENKSRVIHIKNEASDNITLPKELFEGIPSNGIVTMYIGRGNGKVFNLNNKSYYIRSFITQQIRVVLD